MNPLRTLFMMISRMPPVIMLAFIVGLAVTVTIAVTQKIAESQKDFDDKTRKITQELSKKTTVVYVIKDIQEGQTIPSEALEERQIEASKAPVDALPSTSLAAGRIAKYGIATGQLLSQHDLSPQGIEVGFEARLKPGMRAVTFAVDNNSGVAGFVTPESHVDIIGMVGSGPETKAKPLLSDVEVIAVGQTFQKGPGSNAVPASSVTVAVNPEDTQKLIKGVVAGKLYLSLRNKDDRTPVATVDITSLFAKPATVNTNMNTLASLPPAPSLMLPPPIGDASSGALTQGNSPPAPLPAVHEIESWSGSKKDVVQVPAR